MFIFSACLPVFEPRNVKPSQLPQKQWSNILSTIWKSWECVSARHARRDRRGGLQVAENTAQN